MPSRPQLARLSDAIEKAGGEDAIFSLIADGEPMRVIADKLGTSRGMVYHWIHAGGGEREQRWEAAKEIAAHVHVEDAGEILDTAPGITSADVSLARARAEHRMHLAAMFNRRAYGEDKAAGVNVQIDIGQLHLDALRSSVQRPALRAAEAPALPAEVIEE